MSDSKPPVQEWSNADEFQKTDFKSTKSDAIQININGGAFQLLYETAMKMADIDSKNPPEMVEELVKKAIALVLRSQGKEIVLRDKGAAQGDIILLWK